LARIKSHKARYYVVFCFCLLSILTPQFHNGLYFAVLSSLLHLVLRCGRETKCDTREICGIIITTLNQQIGQTCSLELNKRPTNASKNQYIGTLIHSYMFRRFRCAIFRDFSMRLLNCCTNVVKSNWGEGYTVEPRFTNLIRSWRPFVNRNVRKPKSCRDVY
jgi:hypothetical protein